MNMVTHIVGAAFGLIVLILCVAKGGKAHDEFRIVGGAIYGVALIFLYTMSAVYHGLIPGMGKKVLQVLDHCTIYFLIAGTYTPILFGPIREESAVLCWVIFGIVWGISAAACVFTAIDHNKYKRLSMICYLGLGWTIIFAVKPTIRAITWPGFWYLISGGVAYSIGAVLYALGKKKQIRYMHSVFHLFVLLGTVLQFITVYFYCM